MIYESSSSSKAWIILAHIAVAALVGYGFWISRIYLFGGSVVVGSILLAIVLFVGVGHMLAWRLARQLAAAAYLLTAISAPVALFSPFGASESKLILWELVVLMAILVTLCLAFVWALTRLPE